MQAEHDLFDCVEIMLFGIPLICHMAWYTEQNHHIVLLHFGSMTIAFPAADNDL